MVWSPPLHGIRTSLFSRISCLASGSTSTNSASSPNAPKSGPLAGRGSKLWKGVGGGGPQINELTLKSQNLFVFVFRGCSRKPRTTARSSAGGNGVGSTASGSGCRLTSLWLTVTLWGPEYCYYRKQRWKLVNKRVRHKLQWLFHELSSVHLRLTEDKKKIAFLLQKVS